MCKALVLAAIARIPLWIEGHVLIVARALVTYVLNAGDVGFFQGIGTQFVHSQRSFAVLAVAGVRCADMRPSDAAAQSDYKSLPM